MRIVSYQSGKVWVKKSEREEKYPHKERWQKRYRQSQDHLDNVLLRWLDLITKKLEVDRNERNQENEKRNQEATCSLIGKEKILIIKIL